jgi:putative flippase GtrA
MADPRKKISIKLATESSFIRWIGFSGFSFAMVFGLTTFLVQVMHVGEKLAFLIPLSILFVTNFFVCRYFVYRNTHDSIVHQFLRYSASSIGFRVLEYVTYWLLLDFLQLWYVTVMLVVMPTSFVMKFLFFKVTVFGHRQPPPSSEITEADIA